MPELLRRMRFQIHLSTGIVLMFAAGGIMWVNLVRHKVPLDQAMADDINAFAKRAFATITSKTTALNVLWDEHYSITEMGWPCRAGRFNDFEYVCTQGLSMTVVERTRHLDSTALAIDIAVALVLLTVVAVACEWLIRRRAR